MRNKFSKALLSIGISAISLGAFAQTSENARIQAIHNCPDPNAQTVDLYLNTTLLIDNFNYQDASKYIDAPDGTQIDLSICASNSSDTTNAIFRKSFTLDSGKVYTIVAGGGLAETGNTSFDLFSSNAS